MLEGDLFKVRTQGMTAKTVSRIQGLFENQLLKCQPICLWVGKAISKSRMSNVRYSLNLLGELAKIIIERCSTLSLLFQLRSQSGTTVKTEHFATKKVNNGDKLREIWSSMMLILQLVSELNYSKCSAVKHESLLREHPGNTQCALDSHYGGLQVIKPRMKEVEEGD